MADGTEREYEYDGPTEDGQEGYCCPYCGYHFIVGKDEPVECPVCQNPPDLLPCPFCGEDRAGLDWNPEYGEIYVWATCESCGSSSGGRKTARDAALAWNNRTAPEIPDPKIEVPNVPRLRIRYCDTGTGHYYKCGCGYRFGVQAGHYVECPACEDVRKLTPTLKTCPFCGERAGIERRRREDLDEDYTGAYYYVAHCLRCQCETVRVDTPEEAAESWNHRPAEPKPQAPPNAWFRGQGKPPHDRAID